LDGYAFCTGLNGLIISETARPGLQSMIRSVTYLIRGAIFRPKFTLRSSRGASLGELIDMYHTRKATIPHDKVYALLGMSSKNSSIYELSLDYALPWKHVWQQLIELILGKSTSLEILENEQVAVIKTRGSVVGRIQSVIHDDTRYDRQQVNITFSCTSAASECEKKWGTKWALQVLAKPIQEGDILCLLEGTTKPTIIRNYRESFYIVAIAVVPLRKLCVNEDTIDTQWFSSSPREFERAFILVWDWNKPPGENRTVTQYDNAVLDYLEGISSRIPRLHDMVLILQDAEEYEEARKYVQEMMKDTKKMRKTKNRYQLLDRQLEALICVATGNRKEAEEILLHVVQRKEEVHGRDHPSTLDSKAYLVSLYLAQGYWDKPDEDIVVRLSLATQVRLNGTISQDQLIMVIQKCSDSGLLDLLLSLERDRVVITEEIVEVAVSQPHTKAIETLLNQRGKECHITSNVLKAVAGGLYGVAMMELLLDRRGIKIQITQEVAEAIVRSHDSTGLIKLLLNRQGKCFPVTESLLLFVVNQRNGKKIMKLLVERRGDEVQITERVLAVVIESYWFELGLLRLLFKPQRADVDDLVITGVVLKAVLRHRQVDKLFRFLHNLAHVTIPMTTEVLELVASSGRKSLLKRLHRWAGVDVVPQQWVHIVRLFYAVVHNIATTILELIDIGTPINIRDANGRTPIFHAVLRGHVDVASIFLETGTVDINEMDDYHETLLSLSARRNNLDMARLLLDHGAKQACGGVHGKSAVEVAQNKGWATMVDLLLTYQAQEPKCHTQGLEGESIRIRMRRDYSSPSYWEPDSDGLYRSGRTLRGRSYDSEEGRRIRDRSKSTGNESYTISISDLDT
jgi:hypothetical protein